MFLSTQNALQLVQSNELHAMSFIKIDEILGKPEYADSEKWIYTLEKSFLRIFSKKLNIYFINGTVADYYICEYVIKICINRIG